MLTIDCFTDIRLQYPGLDNSHFCTTYRADYFGAFLFLMEHLEGTHVEDQLQKPDEFFTAGVKKAVISGSAKSFGQHMEHQQIEKIFATHCPGLIFFGFGMQIPESNLAVFAFQDILFLYDASVEISAEIY
jgi:hypothetical protein